jgi:hypothetical protein
MSETDPNELSRGEFCTPIKKSPGGPSVEVSRRDTRVAREGERLGGLFSPQKRMVVAMWSSR